MEMIATFADDEFPGERPLSKLRLTCRQLRDQLDPVFAQRYLSEPFIAMSRYSLEALIYTCQHPIFGPKVRKVRLRAYADMDRVMETLSEKVGYGLLEPDELPTAHQTSRERVKETVENFIGENLHFRTSDEDTKLLRTAFKVLSEYARPLILCVETSCPNRWANRNCSAPVGFGFQATNAFLETVNWKDRRYPACGMILQNLLKPADRSGCEVQGIEMDDFGSISLNHDGLYHPFDINHPLVLGLESARFHGYIPQRHVNGQMALLKLINKARKLTSLSLGNSFVSGSVRRYCLYGDLFLGQIQLPALQALDLCGVMTAIEKLRVFLMQHHHTIKQLSLRDLFISIPAPGNTCFSSTMSWIHHNIALDKLVLGEIRVVLPGDWQDLVLVQQAGVPWHSSVTSLEGSAAVEAGLEELCDECKRLRKLFTHVKMPCRAEKISLFARTAGMSEEEFRQDWVSVPCSCPHSHL